MEKRILLVRHAKAERMASTSKDIDRKLTSEGIMQSAKLGNHLHFLGTGTIIDLAISSPAVRASQTARMVLEQMDFDEDEDELQIDLRLYGSGLRGYLAAVNAVDEKVECVAFFGHNPDISFFAEYLTSDDIMGSMKKATLIELAFEGFMWDEISGKTGKLVRRIDIDSL